MFPEPEFEPEFPKFPVVSSAFPTFPFPVVSANVSRRTGPCKFGVRKTLESRTKMLKKKQKKLRTNGTENCKMSIQNDKI